MSDGPMAARHSDRLVDHAGGPLIRKKRTQLYIRAQRIALSEGAFFPQINGVGPLAVPSLILKLWSHSQFGVVPPSQFQAPGLFRRSSRAGTGARCVAPPSRSDAAGLLGLEPERPRARAPRTAHVPGDYDPQGTGGRPDLHLDDNVLEPAHSSRWCAFAPAQPVKAATAELAGQAS